MWERFEVYIRRAGNTLLRDHHLNQDLKRVREWTGWIDGKTNFQERKQQKPKAFEGRIRV